MASLISLRISTRVPPLMQRSGVGQASYTSPSLDCIAPG